VSRLDLFTETINRRTRRARRRRSPQRQ